MRERIDIELAEGHRLLNVIQSLLLLGGMGGLLLLLGYVLAGGAGALVAAGTGIFVLVLGSRVTPGFMLRLYRARPLHPQEAGGLYGIVSELARRAGLTQSPRLYYIPSPIMNAFTVGDRKAAAFGLTDGLLRRLQPRELVGVIAHEMSHVQNRDTRVMVLADAISRMTSNLSFIGQIMVFINLPLVLMGAAHISWFAIVLLLAAPTVSALLQLALSRTREFHADLGAVRLTGDPEGLASALAKMERYERGWLGTIFIPGRRQADPSLLRSHPNTEERIHRLLALEKREDVRLGALAVPSEGSWLFYHDIPVVERLPRYRHVIGLWH